MPDKRLDVNSGETKTIESQTTESYFGADVDGNLDIEGTLELVDDPTIATHSVDDSIKLPDMSLGTAVFLGGMMSILMGAAALFRNRFAAIMVSIAIVTTMLSGLIGIGLELTWIMLMLAAVMLIAGLALGGGDI